MTACCTKVVPESHPPLDTSTICMTVCVEATFNAAPAFSKFELAVFSVSTAVSKAAKLTDVVVFADKTSAAGVLFVRLLGVSGEL